MQNIAITVVVVIKLFLNTLGFCIIANLGNITLSNTEVIIRLGTC